MAIDPVSAVLLTTCLMTCWPCLFACCLTTPFVPYPVVIIQPKSKCPDDFQNPKAFRQCYVCLNKSHMQFLKRFRVTMNP